MAEVVDDEQREERGGSFAARLSRIERKVDYLIALGEMQVQAGQDIVSQREDWLEAHRRRRTG